MKLKSMTAFIKEQFNRWDKGEITSEQYVVLTDSFRMFLEKIAMIWMFVPCDKDGNVLQQPKPENYFDVNKTQDLFTTEEKESFEEFSNAYLKWEEAKERVLFEGFEYVEQLANKKDKNVPYHKLLYNGQFFYIEFEVTIERMVEREFELTPTAQKQIGL